MVRVPGQTDTVGPVSLDQIRRGLDHGKLDAGAEIARQGKDAWQPARAYIDQLALTQGPASAGAIRPPLPSVAMGAGLKPPKRDIPEYLSAPSVHLSL